MKPCAACRACRDGFIGVLLWRRAEIKAKCYAAARILPGALPPAASRRVNLLELCRWGGWSSLWCSGINFQVLFSQCALSPFQKESASTSAAACHNCAQLSGVVFLWAQECWQHFHFDKNRGDLSLERPRHCLPSSTLCGEMILLYLERGKLHWFGACYVHSSFGSHPAAVPSLISGRSFFAKGKSIRNDCQNKAELCLQEDEWCCCNPQSECYVKCQLK